MTADENRIYISDFCTLYVLNGEDYAIIGKWKIGDDLSSDICGIATDEKRAYCSIRNGRIITVDKRAFGRNEYIVSDASMWSLKIYNNYLLCGTVTGQLLLLDRETMTVVIRLTLGKQNVRSLYINGARYSPKIKDK